MGLAGLGDLVLTCTDDQSRNRRFGLRWRRAALPQHALAEIGQVVEGYTAAKAVRTVAASGMNVEMPLCEGVFRVLYEGVPAQDAVRELMTPPDQVGDRIISDVSVPRESRVVFPTPTPR